MPQKKAIRPKCQTCNRKRVNRAGAKFCSTVCANRGRPKKIPKKAEEKLKKLSPRRQRFVAAIVEGKNQRQSAIQAGYSPKSADQQATAIMKDPVVKQTMSEILDSIGITDFYLAEHLRDGLAANKAVSIVPRKGSTSGDLSDASGSSVEFVDVPDWGNRNKYYRDALNLKGHLGDVPVQPTALNIQINIRGNQQTKGRERYESAENASEVQPPARVHINVASGSGNNGVHH